MARPTGSKAARDKELHARIAKWIPSGWDELVAAWDELLPEAANPGREGPIVRRFQSSPINPQLAGKVFERWIIGAFQASGARVEYPYKVPMPDHPESGVLEEIDGLVFDNWQGFLVQSKFWEKQSVDSASINDFFDQVSRRPAGTLGLFFTAFSVTVPALEKARRHSPQSLLLIQRGDIAWACRNRNMLELIGRKWRGAVKFGRFDYEVFLETSP